MKSLVQYMNEARLVGGNSGYVGYSMSKRAANAREEGRYPKTDFKKIYGLTDKTLTVLVDLGIITDTEWHHTSKFGNKTTFYDWAYKSFQLYYEANKPIVVERIKKNELDALRDEFFHFDEEYTQAQKRVQDKLSKVLDEYAKYRDDYKKKNNTFDMTDGGFLASNGCVVRDVPGEGQVVFKDGERLSKRRGGGLRDAALNELRAKMNDWKQGLMTYKEFLTMNYDGIVREIMGSDMSHIDKILNDNGAFAWFND